MATASLNVIPPSSQFNLLHSNWKAALKAANSFPGKDAHADLMDAQVDDRAAILLETPALNIGDIAKKFAILEFYLCLGGGHGNETISLAFEQINFDFKCLAKN